MLWIVLMLVETKQTCIKTKSIKMKMSIFHIHKEVLFIWIVPLLFDKLTLKQFQF